jgi:hypothetical protein
LFFVDVGKDSNIADDATTFSIPLVVPIRNEELEDESLDVNVSQWSCKKELIGRVVHT